jgi:hypothetical protein
MKPKDEVSVFFTIQEDLLKEFLKAIEIKGESLGIQLNKKQAFNLAIKQITEQWTKEKPESI